MGPFDALRQLERSKACERIQQRTTDPAVRQMWQRIQAGLAHNEAEYTQRVKDWYTTHRGIIQ